MEDKDPIICPYCGGTGSHPWMNAQCSFCHGTGEITEDCEDDRYSFHYDESRDRRCEAAFS